MIASRGNADAVAVSVFTNWGYLVRLRVFRHAGCCIGSPG